MDFIEKTCPDCGEWMDVPKSRLGGKIRCPACRSVFRVAGSPSVAAANKTRGDLPRTDHEWRRAAGDTTNLRPGDRFADRFTIKRKLGSGSFGTVYKAFDDPEHRWVALKIPADDIWFNNLFMERFRTEARILGQLRHPNIVAYYHAQLDLPPRFLAAEFVDGLDLEQEFNALRSRNRWFDLPRSVWIVHELAGALHHAHLKGVVHRDVKPANILIRGDIVKLTDFGLARFGDPRMTVAGAKIGTPFYMSPEQVSGDPARVGARSDQYGLAVVLYELLCKQRPFTGPSAESIYPQIIGKKPRNPRSHDRSIPRALANVCLKALAKDPEDRWPDCAAFAAALRRWLPEDHGATPQEIANWLVNETPPSGDRAEPDGWSRASATVPKGSAAAIESTPRVDQAPQHRSHPTRGEEKSTFEPLAASLKETAKTIKSRWPRWIGSCVAWLANWVDVLNAHLSGSERPPIEPPPVGSLVDDGIVSGDDRSVRSTANELPTDGGHQRPVTVSPSVLASRSRSESNARSGSGPIPLVSPGGGSRSRPGASHTNPTVSTEVLDELAEIAGHHRLSHTNPAVSTGVPVAGRSYHQTLEAAHTAWRQHQLRDACFLLDQCNLEDRGWEWAYLHALCRLPITTYSDQAGEIGAIVFDRTGRLLAVGEAGDLRVWDTSAQRLVCWLTTDWKRIDAIAFSPNGCWLASAGGRSIQITDVQSDCSAQATQVLQGHGAMVTRLAFAADGIHLASASLDQSVRIWNFLEGRERLELQGRAGPVQALAFHPHDPRLLLAAHVNGTVVLWDWVEATERRRGSTQSGAAIDDLAFHPHGHIFTTGGRDGQLTFWNLERLEPIATLQAHQGSVSSLDFHPNGRWLASLGGGKERSLRVGAADPSLPATELGREVAVVPFGSTSLNALTFSPVDDGRLALAGGRDQTVKIWDGTTFWNSLASGGNGDRVRAAAIDRGGRHVAVARLDGAIEVRSLAGNNRPRVFPGRGVPIRALAFHPGHLHLVAGGDDGALTFWDLVEGGPAERLQAHRHEVLDLTYDRDGRLLATAGAEGTVRLWNVHRHEPIFTLPGHGPKMAIAVAFAYEGGELRLYSGGADRLIHVWNPQTGARLASLEGHHHRVIALAPTADDRRLVSLGTDRTLMVWALDRREPVLVLRDVDILADLAWHRQASVLAAVGEDRSLIQETLLLPPKSNGMNAPLHPVYSRFEEDRLIER
jgi:WD40 repeat protein/serine/threonine protein kinase